MEQWVRLKKPLDRYKVSNYGRFMTSTGRILKLCRRPFGKKVYVQLCEDHSTANKSYDAKLLIAGEFLNREDGMDRVRCKDGNQSNLHVDNLEWYDSSKECADLTRPTKAQIVECIHNGMNCTELIKHFKIHSTTLRNLLRRYQLSSVEVIALTDKVKVDMDTEIWADLTGRCEGYQVSNYGGFRSVKTGKNLTRTIKGGFIYVSVTNKGRSSLMKLSTLVASVFLEQDTKFKYLVHIDGDRSNCRADNLKWSGMLCSKLGRDREYYSEAPEQLQELVHSLAKGEKVSGISKYVAMLQKFGFPESFRQLKELALKHQMEGNLTEYAKGFMNIEHIPLNPNEVKLPIKNFPGYYITNQARVISHKLFTKEVIKSRGLRSTKYGDEIYVYLSKTEGGSTISVRVAKLIAEHFIPNPKGYRYFIFLDGDSTNCSVDNIEWVDLPTYRNSLAKRSLEAVR